MSPELILALGWTLLHSVWQIGLLGLTTLGLERMLRLRSALLRHNLSLFFLGGMVLVCLLTFWREWHYFASIHHFGTQTRLQAVVQLPFTDLVFPAKSKDQTPVSFLLHGKIWIESHLGFLVGCWSLGMAVFSLRFGLDFLRLGRLRRQSTALDNTQIQQSLQVVQASVGLRRQVELRVCKIIPSPLTFGFFFPVVLLPAALISQTPPALLEALLRHELIHIRRADFLINLLLAILQILWFYHPLIWVITRRIQELREEACDEAVLSTGCNNLVYAEALLYLQKLNHHQKIPLVMQAQNQSSHFSERIRQILLGPSVVVKRNDARALSGSILLAMLLLALGTFVTTIKAEKTEPVLNLRADKKGSEKTTLAPMTLRQTPNADSTSLPVEDKPTTITRIEKPAPDLELLTSDSIPSTTGDVVLSVAAERMNVLYMGVENPIRVALSGVPADQVSVSSNDLILKVVGKGKYIAIAKQLGKASIIVEAPNYRQTVEFRVKQIPDPVAFLDNPRIVNNGEISVSMYRAFKGLNTALLEFDLAAQCEITEFKFICKKANGNTTNDDDLIVILNQGAMFNRRILDVVENVNIGDQIIFAKIEVKCPGDAEARPISGIARKIVADPPK